MNQIQWVFVIAAVSFSFVAGFAGFVSLTSKAVVLQDPRVPDDVNQRLSSYQSKWVTGARRAWKLMWPIALALLAVAIFIMVKN